MNEATMESGTDVNRLSEVHSISGRTLKSGSQGTSLKGRWWSGACAVRGGSREQEYSKRENAPRPACRDFTYLTRNLHARPSREN